MQLVSWLRQCFSDKHDALADFRTNIAIAIATLSVAVLLPFLLLNMWQGRYPVALVTGGAAALMAVSLRSMRLGQAEPIPRWLLMTALNCSVVASTLLHGMLGALWAYPVLFIGYFVLSRRWGSSLGLLLTVGASSAVAHAVGWPEALRQAATMLLTLTMINTALNVIGDLQGALVRLAVTDPLTGAYNRRHLSTRLTDLTAPSSPNPTALLAIDIDHFKRINDRYGHGVGDEVLKATVAAINSRKRSQDQLFRTGGEEFVLLLPATAQADAMRVAEALRQRIADTPMVEGEQITVSIGVSLQPPGAAPSQWMRAADEALYDAKRGGRNRIVASAATSGA